MLCYPFIVAMTTCERERKRAITMSSRSVVGMFVASCQPDGSFEQTQCHNATGFCWCVDDLGNELMGTRQWGKPNCTRLGQLNFFIYLLVARMSLTS